MQDAYFSISEEEANAFYDFHEPMKTPEAIWKFSPPVNPLNIEFSNSKHLLIEGSMMDMNVGVYQVE